jgi:dienelactone hydrolase/predicted Ser/Thr protein kinase
MIGQTISHYRIIEQLGAGGMGVVYKAEDLRLKRLVALKFLPIELTQDLEAKERLMHEAQAASALDHPHICVIHEIDEAEDGRLFVAMAYYDGETLKQRIARGPLAAGEAVDLAIQIAQAAAAAHDAGIVHRDIKPANIIITRRGEARLLDFGIATLAGQTRITRTGTTLGTVAYMSPEQISGADPDPQSDVWAIGVVLFEMLTGGLPFEGNSEAALMNAILNQPSRSLRSLRPEVPGDLETAVSRALTKNPADRYTDAEALVRSLQPHQSGARAVGITQAATERPRRRLSKAAAAGIGVVLLAGVAIPLWNIKRERDARANRDASAAEIASLVTQDRYVEAFAAAVRAHDLLRDDPALADIWETVSVRRTITTTPPGAIVSVREVTPESTWHVLGETPLTNARLPLGVVRWRFEKPGFEPSEFVRAIGNPLVGLSTSVELRPAGGDAGSITVPAADLALTLAGYDYNHRIPAAPFDIDRVEVTNRDFKAFVDAGGYQRKDLWTEPIVRDGRPLAWGDAMALFRDQTGRPGPAGWEVGTFPAGRDEHPVTGVSWYEAAAYARFRGRALPTIYHWATAAGIVFAGQITPFSHIGGSGPQPVGRSAAISPYGLLDVAGNVKEWCWNETTPGSTRYVLGGAWNEPEYMFLYGDARPPLERAANIGFRTVKYLTPASLPPATTLPVTRTARDYKTEKPVSAEVFAVYRSLYASDPVPLEPKIERTDDSHPAWRREVITVAATYGKERVPLHLYLPRQVKPPYSVVVLWPGSSVIRAKSSDNLPMALFDFVMTSGRAVVAPIMYGTYERNNGRDSSWPDTSKAYREWVMRQVNDVRRAMDYLETRDDVRRDAIGYLGFSWGARMGSIVLALDPRYRTAVLLSGGLSTGPAPAEVDPLNFAPHVAMPVLMVNGDSDFIFPLETSQKALFTFLGPTGDRKKHVVLQAGHSVGSDKRSQVIREILDWMDRYLGRVE